MMINYDMNEKKLYKKWLSQLQENPFEVEGRAASCLTLWLSDMKAFLNCKIGLSLSQQGYNQNFKNGPTYLHIETVYCSAQYLKSGTNRTPVTRRANASSTYLYLSLVCPGRSRLLYCLERADKSVSPLPEPPLAGSKVGRAAVVIAPLHSCRPTLRLLLTERTFELYMRITMN